MVIRGRDSRSFKIQLFLFSPKQASQFLSISILLRSNELLTPEVLSSPSKDTEKGGNLHLGQLAPRVSRVNRVPLASKPTSSHSRTIHGASLVRVEKKSTRHNVSRLISCISSFVCARFTRRKMSTCNIAAVVSE